MDGTLASHHETVFWDDMFGGWLRSRKQWSTCRSLAWPFGLAEKALAKRRIPCVGKKNQKTEAVPQLRTQSDNSPPLAFGGPPLCQVTRYPLRTMKIRPCRTPAFRLYQHRPQAACAAIHEYSNEQTQCRNSYWPARKSIIFVLDTSKFSQNEMHKKLFSNTRNRKHAYKRDYQNKRHHVIINTNITNHDHNHIRNNFKNNCVSNIYVTLKLKTNKKQSISWHKTSKRHLDKNGRQAQNHQHQTPKEQR